MIARTTDAPSGERKRRSAQVVEVRIVVDVRLPDWLHSMAQSGLALAGQQQTATMQAVAAATAIQVGGLTPLRSPEKNADPPRGSMEENAVPNQEVSGSAFLVTSSGLRHQPVVSTSTAAAEPTIVVKDSPSLVELYEELLAKKERLRNEPKQVRDDLRYVAEFERWVIAEQSALRISIPRGALSKTLEFSEILESWARELRAREVGGSVGQTMKKMNAVGKLSKACHASGLTARAAKAPTAGELQLMGEVSDTEDSDSEDLQGEPVTIDEFRRMVECCRGADVWPYLPKYWELKLTASYYAGFRLQDWFAELNKEKRGLLWSGVLSEPICPRLADVINPSGWLWFLVHKTKKKDQKKARNPRLLIPQASPLAALMEPYRGLDPERVFPVPCNKRSSHREFHAILSRAGLDDANRMKAGKPIIRISEGKRNIASFRKGCAAMWADAVGPEAASYMLKHAVSEAGVSSTTRDHYLQIYRPLKAIVPAVESLPIW
jgi:hypothetical protein